jgi:hypothetical protein
MGEGVSHETRHLQVIKFATTRLSVQRDTSGDAVVFLRQDYRTNANLRSVAEDAEGKVCVEWWEKVSQPLET